MIVASNGMLTGGRVLGHLRNLIDDPTATLLFVGYQGEGTLGAHLQAGAKTVKLDGSRARRSAARSARSAASRAHADESELLDWLGHFADGQAGRARRASRGRSSSSTATRRPRSSWSRRSRRSGFTTKIPHWREVVTLGLTPCACRRARCGTPGPPDGTREAIEIGRVTIGRMAATALAPLLTARRAGRRPPPVQGGPAPPAAGLPRPGDPRLRAGQLVPAADWVMRRARAEEAANRGEYFLDRGRRRDVIVVRGADGELRAFHNVCRHRGSTILEEPCGKARPHPVPVPRLDLRPRGPAPVRAKHTEDLDDFEPRELRPRPGPAARRGRGSSSSTSTPPRRRSPTLGDLPGHFERFDFARPPAGPADHLRGEGELEVRRRELLRVLPLPGDPPPAQPADAVRHGPQLPPDGPWQGG